MKRTFMLLLPAWLLLAPVFAFAQLTAGEQDLTRECRDNVNVEKNRLSADLALECVKKLTEDNGSFLARLKNQNPESEAAAVDILAFNNALVDLKNIVMQNSGRDMAPHLKRVLGEKPCPLCVMGLGPAPEKIFDWVGKEAGPRLADVKKSVRTWESLGEGYTVSLSSAEYNYDQKRWNAKTIKGRYRTLSKWAVKETDRLTALYGNRLLMSKLSDKTPDPRLIEALREELAAAGNDAYVTKLDRLAARLGRMGYVSETVEPAPAEKKEEELSAAAKNISELKNKPESEQAAYLSGMFDQAASNAGGVTETRIGGPVAEPEGFVFKRLSAKTRNELSGCLISADADGNLRGPLAEELRGTKAGGEILAFYKDPDYAKTGSNLLNFAFTRQPKSQYGGWDPPARMIALNSMLVNNWMKTNQVRPEQLLEGDPSGNPHLLKLAKYLAPTFVHEATHQRQYARAAAAGADYWVFDGGLRIAPMQMEKETEAFSMDSSFMAEQLRKRGPAYADVLCPVDRTNMEVFIEKGVEGLRLENRRDYGHLDSLEGSAAKEFADVVPAVKELEGLEAADPGLMEEAELAQMRYWRKEMDSRFKWYTMACADSSAAEAKINGWRLEINDKLYPPTGAKAPPELL